MFCDTTQFPSLQFFSPHTKPYGKQGLGKHYNMLLDPKLGHGTCKIRQIPCVCYSHTSMLYNPCYPGVEPPNQPC